VSSDLRDSGGAPAPQYPPCGASLSPGSAADTAPDLCMQLLREQIEKRTILSTSARLPPGEELAFDGVAVPLVGV